MGILTPIEGINDVQLETVPGHEKKNNEAENQRQSNQTLPEEIKTLVDEAKLVITPQQTQNFQQLLVNYRDVFTTQDESLGHSDIVQHDKQATGEPIKSQYRKIPVG